MNTERHGPLVQVGEGEEREEIKNGWPRTMFAYGHVLARSGFLQLLICMNVIPPRAVPPVSSPFS